MRRTTWREQLRRHSRSIAAGFTLFASVVVGAPALAAFTPPPNTVNSTIEGCRNDGSPPLTPGGTLPNADGRFVCQDPGSLGGSDTPYTTGNLGKGWNELDLVPFRLILTNSGPAATYNVIIAADKIDAGSLGYDVITEPEVIPAGDLNAFSAAGCAVSATAEADGPAITGGADVSLYRVLTVTHPANATCVIDYAQRLSIESADYNGSNLQAYKFLAEDFKTGKATVPLPVNQIAEQELDKDMTATQDTDHVWNITKTATPAEVQLGNTCDVNNPNMAPVSVRVDWQILPGAPGEVLVVTNIYGTNPASRDLLVDVMDKIYGNIGSGSQLLDTGLASGVHLAANSTQLLFTHTFTAPANVSDLTDTASATYIDEATGVPVNGVTEAHASAPIQPGNQTNTTALITDSESISGNGLKYSADSVVVGSANGTFTVGGASYALGSKLDKNSANLLWTSATQSGSGFVEFNKTVYVEPVPAITSGTLSDTATLTASDGFTASAGPANINISSTALVELTIVKRLADDILQGSDQACFNFEVANSGGTIVWQPEICFAAGDALEKDVTQGGLQPGVYTVTEVPATGWTTVPVSDIQQQVDIQLPNCSNSVTFTNEFAPQEFAHAQVKKVSNPAGFEAGWTFELQWCSSLDPASCTEGDYQTVSTLTTIGTGFEFFLDSTQTALLNLEEGTYRIGEVTQPGWDTPVGASCNDFVVDYPGSVGATFSCTYTNTKLGKVIINKVTDPVGGTGFGYTQDIDGSGPFSLDDGGSKTFLDVPAGSYAVTENDPTPDYDLVSLVCTDDFDVQGYNVVDSSTDLVNRLATINVDPGETVSCTFTNRQRGMVDLLKLTNGVADPSQEWFFSLQGPGVNVTDSTPPALVDFGGVKLIPGETYTICETDIPAGWMQEWAIDGVGPVTAYSPVNGTQCVDFSVDPGETVHFILDNQMPPGGDQRTPGYWKNWSTCSNGKQVETAAKNGGPDAGFYLLDDLIPITIGNFVVDNCEDGVSILDHRDISSGRVKASDPAYKLARNLLAAKLNLGAGAGTCAAVQSAVADGDALLAQINFSGTGDYLKGKKYAALGAEATELASTLDEYNNGYLCP